MTSSRPCDKLPCVSQPTPTYRLIEERLDGTLADFVRRRRPRQLSWRELAAEIEETTGIKVSNESLRTWFADDERESGSAA